MVDICDFHSHILPMADHGSTSPEHTAKQLALARTHGVCRIFATPHFYPHVEDVKSFIARVDDSYARLMAIEMDNKPEVRLGAEVLLCPGVEKLPNLERLAIRGTKTILLELPFNDFSRAHINSVASLLMDGYDIVLAHAERYDINWIEPLIDIGAKLQLNAPALTPLFVEEHIWRWVRHNCVVAIGSDIHGPDKRAYRYFNSAIKRLGKYATNVKVYTDSVWDLSK